MTETSTETRYSLGDRVTVTSHYVWSGRDTYGRSGEIALAHDGVDGSVLYEVRFGDGGVLVPYLAHELFLVRRGGPGAVRHLIHATGPDGGANFRDSDRSEPGDFCPYHDEGAGHCWCEVDDPTEETETP